MQEVQFGQLMRNGPKRKKRRCPKKMSKLARTQGIKPSGTTKGAQPAQNRGHHMHRQIMRQGDTGGTGQDDQNETQVETMREDQIREGSRRCGATREVHGKLIRLFFSFTHQFAAVHHLAEAGGRAVVWKPPVRGVLWTINNGFLPSEPVVLPTPRESLINLRVCRV